MSNPFDTADPRTAAITRIYDKINSAVRGYMPLPEHFGHLNGRIGKIEMYAYSEVTARPFVKWLSGEKGFYTSPRILVTGSRNWDAPEVIRYFLTRSGFLFQRVLDECKNLYPTPAGFDYTKPTLVVGDCPTGADLMATTVAESLGWHIDIFKANWKGDNLRSAGIHRNLRMVQSDVELCHSFNLNHSRGTTHCVKEARARSICNIDVEYEDSHTDSLFD